jgi:PTS system mannose-specific IIB component
VQILPLAQVDFSAVSKDGVRTLVLLRDVAAVPFAFAHGLAMDQLNLGNVHFGAGRRQVSPSVFLAEAELQALKGLADKGVRVEARAVPSEKPVELGELSERWTKGG